MKKPNIIQRIVNNFVKRGLYDLYPDLQNRQPILRVNSEDEQMSGQNTGGFRLAADQYQAHIWTNKAIGILARNIAPLSVGVAQGVGNDTEYLPNHRLNELLEYPNPDLSPAALWEQWVTDQMLGGEWGLEVVRNGAGSKIMELWPRQPHQFTVRPASIRYRKVEYYKIDDGAGEPYQLTPEEFIHFKFYNPLQPFRGLAPITAVRNSIVIDQLAQAWTRLFFRNQARPDYAIIAPEGMTTGEKTNLIEQLKQYGDGEHLHEPVVLETGITDIKTFSFAPKDLEWVNQREMSRDEVAAIFGVPDEMMGYGKDTYENFDAADRVLWTLTLIPIIRGRDNTLTQYFRKVNLLSAGERVITDLRQVPQLQEDKGNKIEQLNKLWVMGVPLNTGSDFLGLGLPAVEGGDKGYISAILVEVGAEPPEPVTENPTEEDPKKPPTEDPVETLEEPAKSIRKQHTEYGSKEHAEVYKRLQKRLDPGVGNLKSVAKKEFQRQQNEIGRKLRDSKSWGRGKWVKDPEKIPSIQELFDMQEEIKKFIKSFKGPVWQVVELIGTQEIADLGIEGAFDINRPTVQMAIKSILEVVSYKTNDTTFSDLTEVFKEAETAGEGIPAIMERLSAYFGDRKSDYQTERIARTTMTSASNAGSVEAWRQSGVTRGKEWVSALSDRSRESHIAAHGLQVGLNEAFTVDGESLDYPGDPTGSPGNIINCLCGIIPVLEDD